MNPICTICNLREINHNCLIFTKKIGGIEKYEACLCKPCYDEFSKEGKFTEFHRK